MPSPRRIVLPDRAMTVEEHQAMLDATMPERGRNGLQEWVRRQFCWKGSPWLYYHTHRSQFSAKGFPDVMAIMDDLLVVAEIKRQSGTATPEQQRWLEAFRGVQRVRVELWKPSDRP